MGKDPSRQIARSSFTRQKQEFLIPEIDFLFAAFFSLKETADQNILIITLLGTFNELSIKARVPMDISIHYNTKIKIYREDLHENGTALYLLIQL